MRSTDVRIPLTSNEKSKLTKLAQFHGKKHAELVRWLIDREYEAIAYSNTPAAIKAKAAAVLNKTQGLKLAQVTAEDVRIVQIESDAIKIYLYHGQPYLIKLEDWI